MNKLTEHRRQQLKYVVSDAISSELVWLCFLLFRWLVYEDRILSVEQVLIPAFDFRLPLVIYPLGCLVVHYMSGYYLRPFDKRYSKEFLTTLISSLVIAISIFFIIIIDDVVVDYHHYLVSLLVLISLQFVLSYIPRVLITALSKHRHLKNEEVVIDLPESTPMEQLYARVREVYPSGKDILVVPRVYDLLTGAAQISELDEQPMIRITDHKMTDSGLCIKRASDVVCALVGMVLLSPVYLVIAILVKCSSTGPILYRQERIGLHAVPFQILKFRTMVSGSEGNTPQLTVDNDPRITPIGHVLRKFRLDELPQLWNVLVGDMSLVGPRPERRYFIEQIERRAPYYCLLYKVRPGLTSWGPIKVGYTDTIEKMIQRLNYDIAYMENQSIRLDLKILFFTIGVLFNGQGK